MLSLYDTFKLTKDFEETPLQPILKLLPPREKLCVGTGEETSMIPTVAPHGLHKALPEVLRAAERLRLLKILHAKGGKWLSS